MKIVMLLGGLYVLMVVYQGNTNNLFTLLKSDTGYIVWIVAIGVFWVIWDMAPNSREVVDLFGVMVLIALFMNALKNPNFLNQFSELKSALSNVGG